MQTLQIKLPGECTDKTLPRVGEIAITGKKFTFGYNSSLPSETRMRVYNGTIGATYPTAQAESENPILMYIGGNATIFTLEEDGCVFVPQKYNISSVDMSGITSSAQVVDVINGDFRSSPLATAILTHIKYKGGNFPISKLNTKSMTRFVYLSDNDHGLAKTLEGSVNDFENKANMTELAFNNQTIYADLDNGDFAEFTSSLTTLRMAADPMLVGDVVHLAHLTGLTTLTLNTCKNITGTAEALLDAMFANGRTSGTLTLALVESSITYNGTIPASTLTVTFTSEGWSVA